MKFSCDVFPVIIHLRIEEKSGDTEWCTEFDWNPTIVLYKSTKTDWRVVLVHELLHAVSSELRRMNVEHTEETEELYCYTMDYFYEKIVTRIEKNNLM